MCQPYSTCDIKELPVFEPNEYFFKHHVKEGEEKWHVKLTAYKEKPVIQYKLLSIKELERLEAKETKE